MPKPEPISPRLRQEIADEIISGAGRNELARRYGVSPGLVSKVARERGLWFDRCVNTATATHARQVDQWSVRVDREAELFDEHLALERMHRPDGKETRKAKRLSYALYNINRHHNGTYQS
jgi:hypothetical protein